MSGGPGGVPECVNANYVGDFFEPATSKGEFSTTYHPNDTVTLSWFGGKIPESLSVSQIFSLFLQNSSTSAVLQSTHITILDRQYYGYGDGEWQSIDQYGNTELKYIWTIPSDLGTTYNRLQIVARNETTTNTTDSFNPGFSLLPKSTSLASLTTLKSSTTLASRSTSTKSQGPTATPPAPKPSPNGLSTGAKAGIRTGSAIIGLLLVGALLFLKRRRNQKAHHIEHRTDEGYEKPELDGKTAEKHVAEIGHGERLELDKSGEVQRIELDGRERARSPVEMAAD